MFNTYILIANIQQLVFDRKFPTDYFLSDRKFPYFVVYIFTSGLLYVLTTNGLSISVPFMIFPSTAIG